MRHVVIDLETLSTKEDAIILQVSAGLYNTDDREKDLFEAIDFVNYKLNAKLQTKRIVDKDTLDWWKGQPEDVKRCSFYPHPEDLDPVEAMDAFALWLQSHGFDKRNDMIWQRGDRDSAWLTSLLYDCGWTTQKNLPYNWWRVRDLRTAVDVLGMSSKLNGYPDNVEALQAAIPGYRHHDAASDVKLEFAILRECGIL